VSGVSQIYVAAIWRQAASALLLLYFQRKVAETAKAQRIPIACFLCAFATFATLR
jgi:hypothetical protein